MIRGVHPHFEIDFLVLFPRGWGSRLRRAVGLGVGVLALRGQGVRAAGTSGSDTPYGRPTQNLEGRCLPGGVP